MREKTGGRQKGTPNKLTKELRIVLKNFVFQQLDQLETLIAQMEPQQRMDLLIKLLPYVLPKIKDISQDRDEPSPFDSFLLK